MSLAVWGQLQYVFSAVLLLVGLYGMLVKTNFVRKLMAMNDNQFYGGSSGVSYAQARYLLYYLQEHGVLHAFWDGYLANRDTDPTGYKTMLDVLGVKNASKFQKKWNRYTLRLRYRR